MRKLLLIGCFYTAYLLISIGVYAQSVKGKVVDAATGNPIPHASIYLNGSSKGTTSDTQGDFILNTSETNIPLVVSCVGYQSEVINNYSNKVLSVKLSQRAQILREVVIGGMSREEQMKIFLTQFIGSTNKDCVISNPDDINFIYRKKAQILEADVNQPLIIYNKKLGYKITYFLTAFSHSPMETFYRGNYVFAEDTVGLKPDEIKKILKARDKVYFGSRMHFIRSLWLDDLEKNKFTITRNSPYFNNESNTDKDKQSTYKAVVATRNGEKFFSAFPNVTIKYNNSEVSYVTMKLGLNEELITANGYNQGNVIWSGKIGEHRVNVLLPFEFEPLEPLSKKQIPVDLSQQVIKDPVFVKMIVKQDSFMKSHNPEKVYVQTDKPNYIVGDTIRLKAYLLNADYLTPTNRSGMLYVELDDHEGKPAKRMMLPVTQGLAWADIALDEKEVPYGSYTLRAYTNWMRNFGEDYIYKKDIYVSPASGNATLVKANFKQEGSKVETTLQFTSLDGKPLLVKDMELKVMDGRKNLSKDQLNTGMDGILKVNFELPLVTDTTNSKSHITIQAKDITKGTADPPILTIPVTINRSEYTDIQFMPEGGSLVSGIPARLGFKAISEDGLGLEVAGQIIDRNQKLIAPIKTSYAGMGSVEFTPKAGESYVAKINGVKKVYALPVVKAEGLTLKITQNHEDDSIKIVIAATPNMYKGPYYLIGQARGIICYAQVIDFNKGWMVAKVVPKHTFPTGVARFTLFDASQQPLNERQVFIEHNDRLNISVTTHKSLYDIRDSVALAIEVNDKEGHPVQGVFSLAITDDDQVKTDSLGNNILSNLLLTSNLKGNIEQPGYYFIDPSPKKHIELDNLMLTQGWTGYEWKDIFKPTSPLPYQPEKEFTVTGTVTNALGKPIENSQVLLFNNNPVTVKDTLTNKDGRFTFYGLFPVDTAIYKLQARNKKGKEFNVGIKMDEKRLPEFLPLLNITPWYVNTDSIRLNNTSVKSAQQRAIANYKGEGNLLKEVTIKEKKVVKGSKNLNGLGEADLIIDEEELKKADKTTLGDLLQQKVKGIAVNGIWTRSIPRKGFVSTPLAYTLDANKIKFVIDGVDLDYFYTGVPSRLAYIKSYLDYFTAEDITGIEVMNNPKYTTKYHTDLGRSDFSINPVYFTYIEITTRSKAGPFMQVTPGTYLYKTLAFTLPAQFYSPKYTVTNKTVAMGTDIRSTLHWEPNVITNAAGKATVSFFTADKPAGYTIIMEGLTPEGEIGYTREKIKSTTAK